MLKKYYLSAVVLTSALTGFETNGMEEETDRSSHVSSQTYEQTKDQQPLKVSSGEPASDKLHLDVQQNTGPTEILELLFANRTAISINLNYSSFTDQIASYLPEYCKILTSLKVAFTEITDLGVGSIAQGYPEMSTLDLSYNCLTDTSLGFIGKYCTVLTSLNLAGNMLVTDEGVSLLMENCPLLKYLNLQATGVSNALMQKLLATIPGLKIEGVEMTPAKTNKAKANLTKKNPQKGKGKKGSKGKNNRKGKGPTPPNPKWDIVDPKAPVATASKQEKETIFQPLPPRGNLSKRQSSILEVNQLCAKAETLLEQGLFEEGLKCFNLALSKLDPKDPLHQDLSKTVKEISRIVSEALSSKE